MSRPWMPLYVGDYLRDTRRLTLEQHGAYLLLIMHYWTEGSIPENDEETARILGCSIKRLPSIWQAIAPYFDENRRHSRIDKELEKNRTISEKRALAGFKGGSSSKGRNNNDRFLNGGKTEAIAKQAGGISHKYITSSETIAAREGASRKGFPSREGLPSIDDLKSLYPRKETA